VRENFVKECPSADVRTVFGDVEVILAYSQQLLMQLQTVVSTWHVESCLGPVFQEIAQCLKVYRFFINGFNNSMDTIARIEKKWKKFAAFLEEQRDSSLLGLVCLSVLSLLLALTYPYGIIATTCKVIALNLPPIAWLQGLGDLLIMPIQRVPR
jgi:hypothetical protein